MASVTDVRLVFDNKLWGGRDHPSGNGRFMRAADILSISETEYGEEVATVRFHHDGRVSRGHFTAAMQPVIYGPVERVADNEVPA
jgi:hypothetical protein